MRFKETSSAQSLAEDSSIPSFNDFPFPAPLLAALRLMGFEKPTPIQALAIPVALEGRDLIGLAQTGTGKTAAFALPVLKRLLESPSQSALILVPTRELSRQVEAVIRDLTQKAPGIRTVNLIGGASMQHQHRELKKGYRILVATPGRLIDHLRSARHLLENVSMLVMDEADRMLDMGFAPQLKQIYPHLPAERQTLLFSATLSSEIAKLASSLLKNPVRVQTANASVPVAQIHQKSEFLPGDQKNDRLLDEINSREGSVLIFLRTKRRADKTAKFLRGFGLSVAAIHGDKTQGQRNRAIQAFKDGGVRILCATDLVARGIDISHVAHVINFDLPQVPEDYVHRIGRTGRNGKAGQSISFISPEEKELWKGIQKMLATRAKQPQHHPSKN